MRLGDFADLKVSVSDALGVSPDMLHLHLGLAFYFLAMLLLRRPTNSLIPWASVLVLEVLNEAYDQVLILDPALYTVEISPVGSIRDLLNTMLWPTVLFLYFRLGAGPETAEQPEGPTMPFTPADPDAATVAGSKAGDKEQTN